MPTDATGTPTSPDSIPTFNTSVDAPSGLGFNAAMAAIQTALSARVSKPSGVTTGDVPVWNGTTWVRPSGTADSTHFLRGDSTWAVLPGTELGYAESGVTSDISVGGGATVIASLASITFDGSTKVRITAGAPYVIPPASTGANIQILLQDGASTVKLLGVVQTETATAPQLPFFMQYEFTPAAGAHTYKFSAVASTGTGAVGSNTVAGYIAPFIRCERA